MATPVRDEVLRVIPHPSKVAMFFGWTPSGRRIHLGEESFVEEGGLMWIGSYCGHDMVAFADGSFPPLGRLDEFCRSCFRSLAWQAFEMRVRQVAGRWS